MGKRTKWPLADSSEMATVLATVGAKTGKRLRARAAFPPDLLRKANIGGRPGTSFGVWLMWLLLPRSRASGIE
jgi:hypothetical protein